MDVRARLASNVKRLRKERGISQEALADMANVTRTYASDIEGAKRNPSITIVQQLADALNVTAGSLLDDIE